MLVLLLLASLLASILLKLEVLPVMLLLLSCVVGGVVRGHDFGRSPA